MEFIEYDGMVLRETESAAKNQIQWLKDNGKWLSHWQYERGANHNHADMSSADREHVRQELQMTAKLILALRDAYPDRSFVVVHIPSYGVSFYQPTEGAPTKGIVPTKPSKYKEGTAWCQTCQRSRSYRLLPTPDPEFPQADWGVCDVCANDLIVASGEILTFVPSTI